MTLWTALDHLRQRRFEALDAQFSPLLAAHERGETDDLTLEQGWTLATLASVEASDAAYDWVEAHPDSHAARLCLATILCNQAWQIRGGAVRLRDRQLVKVRDLLTQTLAQIECIIAMSPRPILALCLWHQIDKYTRDDTHARDHSALFDALLPHSVLLCATYLASLNPNLGADDDAMSDFMREARHFDWPAPECERLEHAYLLELARLHHANRDQRQAKVLLMRAHLLHPHLLSATMLADVLSHAGDHAAAQAVITTAFALGDSPLLHHLHGQVLMALDQRDDAVHAWERALSLGHGEAACALVEAHVSAQADSALTVRIREWLRQGVAQSAPACMRLRAQAFHSGLLGHTQDAQEARTWYAAAADWGDAPSHATLAVLLLEGRDGFAHDPEQAFLHARKAYDLGHLQICALLGQMYFQGLGTPVNFAAAVPLLDEAACQGKVGAMCLLAPALWYGQGCTQNRYRAAHWLDQLKLRDVEAYQRTHAMLFGWGARIKRLLGGL